MAVGNAQSAKKFRMLLIGETGVGKTSLVELFQNYAKQKGQLFDIEKIRIFNMETERDNMESQTILTETYTIDLGNLLLYLTDTPGFADSRGVDQAKKNVADIVTKVPKLDYINCICLVINGTEARITPAIDQVIKQIVKLLPREVLGNTIVLFTKTVKTSSLNFKLETLSKKYGLYIPKSNSFMLDNPFCAWTKEKKEEEPSFCEVEKDFIACFKKLDTIISYIERFEHVEAKKIGELSAIIEEIDIQLTHIDSDITKRNHAHEHHVETNSHLKTKKSLRHYLGKSSTLIGSDSNNITCSACQSNCHENCTCFWTTGFFGSVSRCEKFKHGICSCKHGILFHHKWSYKYGNCDENQTTGEEGHELEIREQEEKITETKSYVTQMNVAIKDSSDRLLLLITKLHEIGSQSTYAKVTSSEAQRLETCTTEMPDFDKKYKALEMFAEIQQACFDLLRNEN